MIILSLLQCGKARPPIRGRKGGNVISLTAEAPVSRTRVGAPVRRARSASVHRLLRLGAEQLERSPDQGILPTPEG
jgi:hypothetical protein